jgi:DNA (cytosine-5)-methyltransferase 1
LWDGGLSYGFAEYGFSVTGVDMSEEAGLPYSFNRIGQFVKMDLTKPRLRGEHEIIVGGPPCEPWSCLNLTRSIENHPLYGCLNFFFMEIIKLRPLIFVTENVPAIKNDSLLTENLESIQDCYDTTTSVIRYSNYGAAFARRRFFTVGIEEKSE